MKNQTITIAEAKEGFAKEIERVCEKSDVNHSEYLLDSKFSILSNLLAQEPQELDRQEFDGMCLIIEEIKEELKPIIAAATVAENYAFCCREGTTPAATLPAS